MEKNYLLLVFLPFEMNPPHSHTTIFLSSTGLLHCMDSIVYNNSLFMCQDEEENEDEHQSFGSFWNLCLTKEPILQCIIVLRAWFVRHSLHPERSKTFVFGLIFVLAHEQPVSKLLTIPQTHIHTHPTLMGVRLGKN